MNEQPRNDIKETDQFEMKLKGVAKLLIMIGGAVFGGVYIIGACFSMYFDANLYSIAMKQVPAIIGLPSAALASLWVVVFLENTSGPIEFEVLGVKFKGAAGPIVLWILSMLAISISIKLLWLS
ncbi:hypothetical protein [Klebsiella variicola]|uniref:hypothetical protein n=1 Tax=Klebsiella variicola TaxID=244366 RepID=UPI0005CC2BCA|nr:hypothetical protein [Klebsiella variicola]MBP5848435.1 hypothetical protein [Klebsiella variicola]HDH1436278.1 hypothetical protein [Klebsiella quasipneumoniae subsp. similipneumoniae]